MKTKLALLGLTSICSLTFFLISAFAQESDPASSAEEIYHNRLLRDAGISSTRASSPRSVLETVFPNNQFPMRQHPTPNNQ